MLSSWYNIVVIGFNPTNYTVKESDGSLRVTAMILEGYISDGENATVAGAQEEGQLQVHVHIYKEFPWDKIVF